MKEGQNTLKKTLSPPPEQAMSTFFTWFLEQVKRQGFTVMLLVIAVWYFYQRDVDRDKKLANCQNENLQLLMGIAERSAAALEQNTDAIEENTEVLNHLEEILGIKKQQKTSIKIVSPKGGYHNDFPPN